MNMIEVKTADLIGPALDWAVAKSEAKENVKIEQCRGADTPAFCVVLTSGVHWTPSTDWSQGGPLIEKYRLEIVFDGSRNEGWRCVKDWCYGEVNDTYPLGETHLIAACRAVVASVFPNTVQVPAELVTP